MTHWNDYFSKLRDRRRQQCNARRRDLLSKIPELKDWKSEFKSLFSDRSSEENAKNLNDLILKSYAKRDLILKTNNINPDIWNVQFDCEICKDYGYVGHGECDCLKLMKSKNIDSRSESVIDVSQSFENFDITVFSEESGQRERMAKVRDLAIQFCDGFPKNERHSILLVGNSGLGKSYLLNCIGATLRDDGVDVRKTTGYKFHHMLNEVVFSENNMQPFRKLLECELLIIDDLGTEPTTKNQLSESYIHALISERFDKKKPTIIATNYSMQELNNRYGERTTSRMLDKEHYRAISLKGEDVRMNRKL